MRGTVIAGASRAAALCLLLCLVSPACLAGQPGPITLRIAAAADLGRALPLIAASFQKRTGIRATCIFGSTGLLTKQAENGAPFDVFMAADELHVAELERASRLAPHSRRLYAIGKLVIWVRPGGRPIRTISDLAGAGVRRVAIANPEHAPYGAAAVQALTKAGIWTEVKPKLVYGENVQQALRYAETGSADAAMVSQALVAESRGTITVVPATLYAPIRQALGVLRTSLNAASAERFAAYIAGPESRALLKRYGFTLPPGKAR